MIDSCAVIRTSQLVIERWHDIFVIALNIIAAPAISNRSDQDGFVGTKIVLRGQTLVPVAGDRQQSE